MWHTKTFSTQHHLRAVAGASAALLLGAVLSACGSQDSTNVEDAVGVTVEAPKVTVLEPGAQPGRELRYQDDGAEQNINIQMSSGFSNTTANTGEFDPQAPAGGEVTTLKSQAKATATFDQDARSVLVVLDAPKIDDLEVAQDVASTEGFQAAWFSDATGKVSSVNFAAPAEATDRGRGITEDYLRTLMSSQVVFPEQPLGVGAQWSVEARVTLGANMLQTTTYTITAIDGDVIELDAEVQRRPSEGAIEDGDTTLEVLASTTTNKSHISVDLRKPLPSAGLIAATTRVIYGQDSSPLRVLQDFTTAVQYS
ncbi:DUF6263 family protein [Corynebacterium gerontici]|uniref:Secreted protein n=1 Tax=Corynebacterium gerontici TaxID=2079234 RepID=A0A3G6J149_9CORY|nr:DUF6263 family protein [Corynebacterium gerontici]AZA11755.1 hypothetical protein CGERO_07275 [Corynebacterium gerontici]